MVVFCSLFLSNTLNQLARTAHNNQVADICFENAGLELPGQEAGEEGQSICDWMQLDK